MATSNNWPDWTNHISVAAIQGRLDEGACIRCGFKPLPVSKETGFREHFCRSCCGLNEADAERQKKALGESVVRYRRRHKKEGLDNLDRLTGSEA